MKHSNGPRITMRYGAVAWGLTVEDRGKSTSFDFSKMTRGDRSKVRRLTVEGLKAAGVVQERRVV